MSPRPAWDEDRLERKGVVIWMIVEIIKQVRLGRAIKTCDMAPDLSEIDAFQGAGHGVEGLDEREGRLVGKRLGEQGS